MLLTQGNKLKLFNFGLGHMTEYGKVCFGPVKTDLNTGLVWYSGDLKSDHSKSGNILAQAYPSR